TTKSLWGASKQPVRSIKRTLQRRQPPPACQGKEREPSPYYGGEGHGRCEDLGCAAPRNPSAYGGWNGCTAHHRTGEIRLGTGVVAAGCRPAVLGSGEAYKRGSREVVERRTEVGGGHSSGDRRGQHNPS